MLNFVATKKKIIISLRRKRRRRKKNRNRKPFKISMVLIVYWSLNGITRKLTS